MLNLKGIIVSTDVAMLWFFDLSIFKVNRHSMLAIDACEVGSLHLWINIRAADDNASKEDHSADHHRSKIFHTYQFLIIKMLDLHHQTRLLGLST